jgi:hypothetical protein
MSETLSICKIDPGQKATDGAGACKRRTKRKIVAGIGVIDEFEAHEYIYW